MAEETAEVPAAEPAAKPKKKAKRAKRKKKHVSTLPAVRMSKADAVRAALKAKQKKPVEGVAYIKEKFGIEVAPQMFSAYKSQFVARRAARKVRKGGADGVGSSVGSGDGKVLDLLVEVRKLSDQYGADTVAKVVEALG
jgi:hypothetical protein